MSMESRSTRRRQPPRSELDPLDQAEQALEELRDATDWDEPTAPQIMINIPPASERLPRPPRTPGALMTSSSTPSGGTVIAIWRRLPPWGGVVVAVVAIVAYTVLALAGKLPSWATP